MKFSILIPAYKKAYLQECIDSILRQSYERFELIIVDDASPEDLYSIVSLYSDPRIKYYRNGKNCGAINVVDNWNICLSYAAGDYVICMGDDDKLLPNCLEEYVKLIEKYPGVGLLHGWTEIIDEDSTAYQKTVHMNLLFHSSGIDGMFIINSLLVISVLNRHGFVNMEVFIFYL
jgi:glycosyltransferase involved in cell wall biosynthesis